MQQPAVSYISEKNIMKINPYIAVNPLDGIKTLSEDKVFVRMSCKVKNVYRR